MWGLTSDGTIYEGGGIGTFFPVPGKLSSITSGGDGTIWGLNGTAVYRWHGTTFQQPGGALAKIAVGNGTTIWGLDSSGQTYEIDGPCGDWGLFCWPE